jgi:hypothetical protein
MPWLRDVEAEDMAILRVQGGLPQGVRSLSLGSSTGVSGHRISTFGFPNAGEVEGIAGYGKVLGRGSQTKAGQPLLQLRSSEITQGFSGAPVWDELRQRVIGMVVIVATPDVSGKMGETAFATPTEILQRVCTDLQIPDINPYRGLNPFTEAQEKFFFGREQEVDKLLDKLRLDLRFLLILGPSGSGKSSIVQAGLIPHLRSGVLPGSDFWQMMHTRPADNPFQQLAAQGLATESNNLTEAFREWLNQHPEHPQLVLVLDQFEELLVNCPEEMSQDFLEQLTELDETSEEGARVGRCVILPLLEFALTELCERREDGVLTFKAYEKVGGVTGGLRQWADQAFNSLEDERKKQLASRIFTDLVYLGNENEELPDTRRRKSLQSLYRNENALTFSPDGSYLATASWDHTAKIWETSSGRELFRLPHEDSVNGVVFSPDGKYLATASMDGIARLWLWRSEDLIVEAQGRLTRNLTQTEWQQYLGEEPYRKTCPNLPEEVYLEDARV